MMFVLRSAGPAHAQSLRVARAAKEGRATVATTARRAPGAGAMSGPGEKLYEGLVIGENANGARTSKPTRSSPGS